MYTIQDVSKGDEVAYNKVKEELDFIFSQKMYDASSAIHDTISLIWLLPRTPEREALRDKLYKLSEDYEGILQNEFNAYKNK